MEVKIPELCILSLHTFPNDVRQRNYTYEGLNRYIKRKRENTLP